MSQAPKRSAGIPKCETSECVRRKHSTRPESGQDHHGDKNGASQQIFEIAQHIKSCRACCARQQVLESFAKVLGLAAGMPEDLALSRACRGPQQKLSCVKGFPGVTKKHPVKSKVVESCTTMLGLAAGMLDDLALPRACHGSLQKLSCGKGCHGITRKLPVKSNGIVPREKIKRTHTHARTHRG